MERITRRAGRAGAATVVAALAAATFVVAGPAAAARLGAHAALPAAHTASTRAGRTHAARPPGDADDSRTPARHHRGGPPSSATARPPRYAAQLVAGVGPIPTGWTAVAHTISAGGLPRVYLTVAPSRPTGPLPVVLLVHGRGMTPDGVLHISELADRIGPALLVVPAGWHQSWNAGDCCGAAYAHRVADVAFIRAALGQVLASNPAAEASRVYAAGFSNGGRLAYQLACALPGELTGFMAVEAVPVEPCSLPRPLDMTIVAQQSDPLLTVESGRAPKTVGGFVEPTVQDTVARMLRADHCTGRPQVRTSGVSVERTWTCAAHTVLRYVWFPAGGHTWRPAHAGTPGTTDYFLQMLGRPWASRLTGPAAYRLTAGTGTTGTPPAGTRSR